MNRAVSSRLSKLEAEAGGAGIVHFVPATSYDEYRTRRDALIHAHGARQENVT